MVLIQYRIRRRPKKDVHNQWALCPCGSIVRIQPCLHPCDSILTQRLLSILRFKNIVTGTEVLTHTVSGVRIATNILTSYRVIANATGSFISTHHLKKQLSFSNG